MIEQDPPQIIVLDIMMPVMNGIEMCRQLRQHEQFRSIPILFLSATNDDMLILSAMSAGGNHFVSKPIRLNLLFELVSNLYNEFKNRGAA